MTCKPMYTYVNKYFLSPYIYNRSRRLRKQQSLLVYQGLSQGLIIVILLGINVRAEFIKLSLHLEAQTSTSISTKQGFQSLFKRASLKPSQSALSYCKINLLYADGLCTLIRGILFDTWQRSLCPSGGWIAMLSGFMLSEVKIWSSVVADVDVIRVASLIWKLRETDWQKYLNLFNMGLFPGSALKSPKLIKLL